VAQERVQRRLAAILAANLDFAAIQADAASVAEPFEAVDHAGTRRGVDGPPIASTG
jgi:hypothetical protein